jgi:hypothetical protein
MKAIHAIPLAALALAAAAPTAGAATISPVLPATVTQNVGLDGITADGGTVFFSTAQPVSGLDQNLTRDIYRTSPAGPRLISAGQADFDFPPAFEAAAPDGGHVLFSTVDRLLFADTDATFDTFDRLANGQLRLTTTPGGPDQPIARARHLSDDGSRVLVETTDRVDPGNDVNNLHDVYEGQPATGAFRLISGGAPGASARANHLAGDGSFAVFSTNQQSVADPDDGGADDVFTRDRAGGLRRLTLSTALPLAFEAASDVKTIVFSTDEQLAPGDKDSTEDLYWSDGDAYRLVSAPNSAGGVGEARFTADAKRVVFEMDDSAAAGDGDAFRDVYERDLAGGALRLRSPGTPDRAVELADISDDGSRVFFTTRAAVPGSGDRDGATDVYEHTPDGRVELMSGGSADLEVGMADATADGSRVFFTTPERLAADDTDGADDIYVSRLIAAPAAPSPISPDRVAPRVSLTLPACSKRIRRKRGACTKLRSRRSSWRTIRGTAADDRGGSGVREVRVALTRLVGKRCRAFTGRRFVRKSCRRAPATTVRARLSGGRWSLKAGRLAAGRYRLRITARDSAGNSSRTLVKTLRLR